MGWWSEWLFPRLCHRALSSRDFMELRRTVVGRARGRVLEVGSGTGLNLGLYPPAVESVDALDPNPGMHELARRRLGRTARQVALHEGRGEALPFADRSFDTVVSTWTLCSVEDPPRVFDEVYRVLRPGGRLLLIEHGLAPEPAVARWQRRLTPIQKRLADGCHLDRDFLALLAESRLEIAAEDRFYAEKTPRFAGHLFRIEAVRD
jgi:ubiquinone/menaquinone biosynthesis C-methylase UbiE